MKGWTKLVARNRIFLQFMCENNILTIMSISKHHYTVGRPSIQLQFVMFRERSEIRIKQSTKRHNVAVGAYIMKPFHGGGL